MLHLALYRPAIPQNTGNIGRLCVGMKAHLHIIRPSGSLNHPQMELFGED